MQDSHALFAMSTDPEERIERYRPLVTYVAKQLVNTTAGPITLADDVLVEEGMRGVKDAIDRFDPKLGMEFEACVVVGIRAAVIRAMRTLPMVALEERAA